jgi:hypothetical protein
MPPMTSIVAVHGSNARAGVVAVVRQMAQAAASTVNRFVMERSKLLPPDYPPTILTGA